MGQASNFSIWMTGWSSVNWFLYLYVYSMVFINLYYSYWEQYKFASLTLWHVCSTKICNKNCSRQQTKIPLYMPTFKYQFEFIFINIRLCYSTPFCQTRHRVTNNWLRMSLWFWLTFEPNTLWMFISNHGCVQKLTDLSAKVVHFRWMYSLWKFSV